MLCIINAAATSSSSKQSVDEVALQRLVDALDEFSRKLNGLDKSAGIDKMRDMLKSLPKGIHEANAIAVLDKLIACAIDRTSIFRTGLTLLGGRRSDDTQRLYDSIVPLRDLKDRRTQIVKFCEVVNDIMPEPKQAPTPTAHLSMGRG